MKPEVSRFAKTAGTYFIGNVLSKLIAIFLLPVYTSYLAPGEYGTYDVAISILNLVTPVAFVQIWDGMYRFVFDCKDESGKNGVVSNSLIVCAVGALIYSALYFVAIPLLGDHLSGYMWVYGLTLPLQYEASYIARAFFKNMLFSVSGVANTLLAALLSITLICGFGWGWIPSTSRRRWATSFRLLSFV